MPSTRHFVN